MAWTVRLKVQVGLEALRALVAARKASVVGNSGIMLQCRHSAKGYQHGAIRC